MTADELLNRNMEQAGVIRALRKNAREDAKTIEQITRERDDARELVRNLYSAGYELRRFTAAYAHNYDEVEGKPGALEAISDFYAASKDISKILAEEAAK